ncbi:secreted protein [Melampsora americana]|nr:secreted protein [Melampsora americana]
MLHYILALLLLISTLAPIQAKDLTVSIVDRYSFCLIVPKDPHTNIGDSEYDGGMSLWCQGINRGQGRFNNFWNQVEVSRPKDGVLQMTGCFNLGSSDRFNANDDGGQYDSNGGDGGRGNPVGSFCKQYPAYVQLIEPSAKRACLRCCRNKEDCNVSQDTSGCPSVIPGNYFWCGN